MRKLALIIMCAVLITAFSGCAKENSGTLATFAVENASGQTISLGDKKETVETIFTKGSMHVVEFEEDKVERHTYWEPSTYDSAEPTTAQVYFDYNADQTVIAIRTESDDWRYKGTTLGMGATREQIIAEYGKKYSGEIADYNAVWLSFDESGKAIEFSVDSPYIVRFDMENDIVVMITIQKN